MRERKVDSDQLEVINYFETDFSFSLAEEKNSAIETNGKREMRDEQMLIKQFLYRIAISESSFFIFVRNYF